MRLNTVYCICEYYQDYFIVDAVKISGEDAVSIKGWERIKTAIDELMVMEFLRKDLKNIYAMIPVPYQYSNVLKIKSSELNRFRELMAVIHNKLNCVVELYKSLGYEKVENCLELKIPDRMDLKSLSSMADDLNFIFNQCPFIKKESNDGVIIKSDVGSIWLVLTGSSIFLSSVGKFMNMCMKVKAQIIGINQFKSMAEERELKNEVLSEVLSMLKEQKRMILSQGISELETELDEKLDPEQETKAEKSFDKMTQWIDKGLQVYAAIDTSKEIQTLFPDQPELKNISSDIIKYLEKKDSGEVE